MLVRTLSKLLVSVTMFACSTVFATPLLVNIAGVQSYGELGDSGNTVLTFDVGANAHVTGLSYIVNLTAFDPSWLSELGLFFSDASQIEGVFFNPGFADDNPGTGTYADAADLVSFGLDFNVGADGILRLEFFEGFDDFTGVDGVWNFGTLQFDIDTPAAVPEPATGLLLGAGLAALGYASRRRRPQHARS